MNTTQISSNSFCQPYSGVILFVFYLQFVNSVHYLDFYYYNVGTYIMGYLIQCTHLQTDNLLEQLH